MYNRHLVTLVIVLVPTLTLAAGVATPPAELVEKMPETTLWLFGATLGAMVGCVWLIAKMFSNGIDKSIQHSKEITKAHIEQAERTNEAQWREIRNLNDAKDDLRERMLVIETDYDHCCGDRRTVERRRKGDYGNSKAV